MLLSSLRAQARRHNPAHTILRQTARCAHQLRSSSSSSSRSHRACVRHAAQTRCVSPSFFFSLSRGFAGGGGAANSPNPNLKGYAVSQASPSSDIILENSQGLRSGVLEVREDPIDEVLEGVRRRLRNRIDKEILEMADIESISDDQGYAEFVNEIGLRLLPVTPYGWLYGRYQVYTYNVTISFSMEYDGKAMNIGDHQLALLENPDRAIGPDTMSTHDHSFVVDISEMDKTGQAMRVNCMSDPQVCFVLCASVCESVWHVHSMKVRVRLSVVFQTHRILQHRGTLY
jgi:hypothetical protein